MAATYLGRFVSLWIRVRKPYPSEESMKIKKFATSCLGVLLITACAPATAPQPTPDVNAIRTSAADTVVAEFTLTAAVIPPTPMLPTETPTLELPPPTDEPIDLAVVTPGTAVPCNDYSLMPVPWM